MTMIEISENAARQIRKVMADRGMNRGGLRVAVKAGGCSGLSYVFEWDEEPRADDSVFEGIDGAHVFVDPRSLTALQGTVLDYDTSLLSKGFMLNNPNATSTCGCGTSFGIG
jgi:iron-sulfur cluster assembly protein